ncbi:TetR/AcrR family transcriptional regulator [Enterococcus faecium]
MVLLARKKSFNEQEVLEKAMNVFLKKGYEKTSMQDLVNEMTIHRRSLYDTFGDKQHLFLLSLRLYKEMIEKKISEEILEDMSTCEKLKKIFSILSVEKKDNAGCLIVNSAMKCSSSDSIVAKEIRNYFKSEERHLLKILLSGQKKMRFQLKQMLKC